ncbi:MAG: HAD-IIB family hydrolase [Blastocatellia bacterium]|nr:HAD-IIB family hydrolase [Blastocatellia bacterium]
MQIKLLALDIDGTLLNSQNKLSDHTKATIQRAVFAGIKVVLVTGRRFHAARPVAQDLNLQLPLITHNGALTKDTQTLHIFDYHPLDKDLARELILVGREHKADTLCCDNPQSEGLLVLIISLKIMCAFAPICQCFINTPIKSGISIIILHIHLYKFFM